MAIKYVKDYYTAEDGTTRTDTKAIQAAIDALSDGDTLAFEEKKIYSIDAPVSFVSYNAAAKTGVTRKHLTIEGNSCTIAGSTTFINTYGCNPAKLDEAYCTSEQKAYENCNAFFYLSDPLKHGLEYCVIRNFNFAWRAPGVTGINDAWYWMQRRFRNSAIGVLGTNHALCAEIYGDDNQNMQSTYFKFGKIEGCYFYDLGCGIYLCGTLDEIERCHFNYCYPGINGDGSVQARIHSNYFFCVLARAVRFTHPYECEVYANTFYKCGSGVFADGPSDSSTDAKTIALGIHDNKIYGGMRSTDSSLQNQFGIYLCGIKDAIIRGNIIKYTTRMALSDDYDDDLVAAINDSGYAIRITGANNPSGGNVNKCERVIVSENIISECAGGINIDRMENSTIVNNRLDTLASEGIRMRNASYIRFEGNTIRTSVNEGVVIRYSPYIKLAGNTVENSTKEGVKILNSSYTKLAGNAIKDSTKEGVVLKNSPYSCFSDNIIEGSGADGIFVSISQNAMFTANKIASSTGIGLNITYALSSNIANNILENCTGGGISVANSNPARISDNTVCCTAPTAILVSQCGGSHICNNTLSGFTENGIKLVGSSASVIAGNMLKGNGSSDRCGIYSNADCKQMDIHGNTLYSFSRENAVVFTSDGPMYVENNAVFESDYTLSNPKDPMVVDTTMPALGVVKIPDTAKINDGDVIMLHMPKDFRAPTVASISFCDVTGSFCKESDGEMMWLSSSYAGSFIKVKYTETANSDGSVNFKITVLGK